MLLFLFEFRYSDISDSVSVLASAIFSQVAKWLFLFSSSDFSGIVSESNITCFPDRKQVMFL